MFFLAAEEAAKEASKINTFDWFMLAFTVIILIGFIRLLNTRPKKNYFAIGFTFVSLALFLVIDYIMIFKIWLA
ncbi:hypothetical protein [Paenibacillus harenae]|uniref:DUF2759 family protein n=1 Tax=Paenibacillus harenae TaxID=306543 RepID=A0ABT9UC90_PAEHA|nr:hypothetical protein [Paenibacillus harenae]MDQ0062083.1 hypothetical protein [Paenibacillus harenae]MDQ0116591.1 hypothetical protein [Paenibacillus harenae]